MKPETAIGDAVSTVVTSSAAAFCSVIDAIYSTHTSVESSQQKTVHKSTATNQPSKTWDPPTTVWSVWFPVMGMPFPFLLYIIIY